MVQYSAQKKRLWRLGAWLGKKQYRDLLRAATLDPKFVDIVNKLLSNAKPRPQIDLIAALGTRARVFIQPSVHRTRLTGVDLCTASIACPKNDYSALDDGVEGLHMQADDLARQLSQLKPATPRDAVSDSVSGSYRCDLSALLRQQQGGLYDLNALQSAVQEEESAEELAMGSADGAGRARASKRRRTTPAQRLSIGAAPREPVRAGARDHQPAQNKVNAAKLARDALHNAFTGVNVPRGGAVCAGSSYIYMHCLMYSSASRRL